MNSNLPGPRANLTLLEVFSGELRRLCEGSPERFWRLSVQLCAATDEFVAMCGARGVGKVGGSSDSYYPKALTKLRSLASDSRWRVREAVAMSLQGLIVDRRVAPSDLEAWVTDGTWFEMRAVAAAAPEEGFLFLREIAGRADPDVVWICGQNLKKNRLRSKFPKEVATIERILGKGA